MSETRRDYMRNDGFLFAADVGNQVMSDALYFIEPTPVTRASDEWFGDNINPSASALGLVAVELSHKMTGYFSGDYSVFMANYGVRDEDLADSKNQFTFFGGLGDQNFTWHFSPVVANAVLEMFESSQLMDPERRTALTLGDWATIIGSRWFSGVMHDMALTRNGLYQTLGDYPSSYQHGKLAHHLERELGVSGLGGRLFEPAVRSDSTDGSVELTAKVSTPLRVALREAMKDRESPGCPIARHAGSLSAELVKTDPHAQNLIATGRLAISASNTDGRVRFTHERTPIDDALGTLAKLLYEYDLRYGTPTWQTGNGWVLHESRPMVGIS